MGRYEAAARLTRKGSVKPADSSTPRGGTLHKSLTARILGVFHLRKAKKATTDSRVDDENGEEVDHDFATFGCGCGSVRGEIRGSRPSATGVCHSSGSQLAYDAPCAAVIWWGAHAVGFTRGEQELVKFTHGKHVVYRCGHCAAAVHCIDKDGRVQISHWGSSLTEMPKKLAMKAHHHYAERYLDPPDGMLKDIKVPSSSSAASFDDRDFPLEARCACGACAAVIRKPRALCYSGFCHSFSSRRGHGAPYAAVAVFRYKGLKVTEDGGLQGFCPVPGHKAYRCWNDGKGCGTMLYSVNSLGLVQVNLGRFLDPTTQALPDVLRPTMHVNVWERIVNLDNVDDIPCFLTLPRSLGGDGSTLMNKFEDDTVEDTQAGATLATMDSLDTLGEPLDPLIPRKLQFEPGTPLESPRSPTRPADRASPRDPPSAIRELAEPGSELGSPGGSPVFKIAAPAPAAPASLLRSDSITPRAGFFSTVQATETAAAEVELLEAADRAVAAGEVLQAVKAHEKFLILSESREKPALVQAALKTKGWGPQRVDALEQAIEKLRAENQYYLQREALCSQLKEANAKQLKCCTAREKYMDEFTARGPPAPHPTPVPQALAPVGDPDEAPAVRA